MTPPGNLPRRYSDDEIGEILRRATDFQQDESEPRGDGGAGMTLAELQEIAAEAGIDPKHLQRAAAALDNPVELSLGDRLAGGPLTISVERIVPGELTQEDFARIVPEIQRAAVGHGNASMVAQTLTWSSETSQRQRTLQVTVSSQGGETLVRAEERLHGLAAALHGGLLGGVGGGVGFGVGMPVALEVLGSVAFAVAIPAAVIGSTYLAVRYILRRTGNARRRVLEKLVDGIARQVPPPSSGAVPGGQPAALPAPE